MTWLNYSGFTCEPPKDDPQPELWEIEQQFDGQAVDDLPAAAQEAMQHLQVAEQVRAGDRILVGAGSRGIAGIVPVLRAVCARLQDLGAEPFILGAMGSHGGDTCAGQREVLQSLGITEQAVGAPIQTSIEVTPVGETSLGRTIYCDPQALEADGVLVVNRVKPHTLASGDIQSGLIKMLVVGLGHRQGAESFHQTDPPQLTEHLCEMGEVIASRIPLIGGIAVVENAHKEPYCIEGVPADALLARERELLQLASDLMPTLPFEFAHSLIVREAGKNYSGTGMDTKVIGRIRVPEVPEPPPFIRQLAALDLTSESHGNATGVGLADFITRRFAEKMDLHATYVNSFSSTVISRAMLPMIMQSDRDAVWGAMSADNRAPGEPRRMAVIDNTLELERLWVSAALYEDIRGRDDVQLTGRRAALGFDDSGRLCSPPD